MDPCPWALTPWTHRNLGHLCLSHPQTTLMKARGSPEDPLGVRFGYSRSETESPVLGPCNKDTWQLCPRGQVMDPCAGGGLFWSPGLRPNGPKATMVQMPLVSVEAPRLPGSLQPVSAMATSLSLWNTGTYTYSFPAPADRDSIHVSGSPGRHVGLGRGTHVPTSLLCFCINILDAWYTFHPYISFKSWESVKSGIGEKETKTSLRTMLSG